VARGHCARILAAGRRGCRPGEDPGAYREDLRLRRYSNHAIQQRIADVTAPSVAIAVSEPSSAVFFTFK
jgi:hypothetical protein